MGAVVKSFHWVAAALAIFSISYGWWMTHLAARAGRLSLYQFRSPVGYDLLEEVHRILSYALLALIVVHVAAALRHHFISRNDILRRMWWSA
jgi:cytochrome b561